MGVDVNQSGSDIEAAHIHGAAGLVGRYVRIHLGDLTLCDGDIADGVDAVFGIDELAALEQQIVGLAGEVLSQNQGG